MMVERPVYKAFVCFVGVMCLRALLLGLSVCVNNPTISFQDINWDYVLVCKPTSTDSPEEQKRQHYISVLLKKGFKTKKVRDGKVTFYGVRAPTDIFHKYVRLLHNPDKGHTSIESPVSPTSRIRIVHFILHNTAILFRGKEEKLQDLIKTQVFEAAFPLHTVSLNTH
uniref:Anoctamin dimerisation domain-containing protein n=1 Tax=Xenopus tropicalis TaxID=8364 RepID=A0A803K2T1_XENTR